ncbi:syncoilin [Chanos chanos]|uniref:Syncoilin n=1 Tax=Chanos chanos TaxID=29144 RepID=A0A6J2WL24_CHACN|nr:syncoilin-like [Chanos chanos]
MEAQEADVNVHNGHESLTEPEAKLQPLFIEEGEEEDHFEDCLEEIQATFQSCETMDYSHKYREAMHAEFNDLLEQMLTQLDNFEATHETKSKPLAFTTEMESKFASSMEMSGTTECMPELEAEMMVSMAIDEARGSPSEVGIELSEAVIRELGTAFEGCIEEVSRLEQKRDELVQELLELEKPMAEEVQGLREELRKAQALFSKVTLERDSLQEETRLAKRRLYDIAKECAQSQVTLASQQQEMEQVKVTQQELEAQLEQLNKEISQLHTDHQNHLEALHNEQDSVSQASSIHRTRSYLSQGRRASSDLQQYLQEGIKSLEEWYEPRLVALLKRRENSAEALSKAKELCQELKARLGPLREEEQKLRLQRARLEDRIQLMERQRKENVGQFRERVDLLEENSRELKTELQIQRNKTKEMELLRDSLTKELHFLRQSIEGHKKEEPVLVEEKN